MTDAQTSTGQSLLATLQHYKKEQLLHLMMFEPPKFRRETSCVCIILCTLPSAVQWVFCRDLVTSHCVHRGRRVSMFSSTSHDDKAHCSVSLCARSPGLQQACHKLSPGALAKGPRKVRDDYPCCLIYKQGHIRAAGEDGGFQMLCAVAMRQSTVRLVQNTG